MICRGAEHTHTHTQCHTRTSTAALPPGVPNGSSPNKSAPGTWHTQQVCHTHNTTPDRRHGTTKRACQQSSSGKLNDRAPMREGNGKPHRTSERARRGGGGRDESQRNALQGEGGARGATKKQPYSRREGVYTVPWSLAAAETVPVLACLNTRHPSTGQETTGRALYDCRCSVDWLAPAVGVAVAAGAAVGPVQHRRKGFLQGPTGVVAAAAAVPGSYYANNARKCKNKNIDNAPSSRSPPNIRQSSVVARATGEGASAGALAAASAAGASSKTRWCRHREWRIGSGMNTTLQHCTSWRGWKTHSL